MTAPTFKARAPRWRLGTGGVWELHGRTVPAGDSTLRIAGLSGWQDYTEPPEPPTFVYRVTKPNALNTFNPALIDGTIDGDLVMSAGQVVRNKIIKGFVTGAPGSLTENCDIRGRGTTFIKAGLFNANVSATNYAVARFCKLRPTIPRYYLNGFDGKGFFADRCDISGVVDGLHSSGDSKAWGNYIHGFAFFNGTGATGTPNGTDHSSDPEFPGWPHIDGWQCMGGPIDSVGNNFELYIDESMSTGVDANLPSGTYAGQSLRDLFPKLNYGNGHTLTPKQGRMAGWKIEDNWIEGGRVHFQMPAQGAGYDSGNNGFMAGNKHGLDIRGYSISSVVRWEINRQTASMGTVSTDTKRPEVFGDFDSVRRWTTATTTPVAVGRALPGTYVPLAHTLRKA